MGIMAEPYFYGAAFQAQDGDYAIIRLQAIRLYDLNVSWAGGSFANVRQAVQVAHGFATGLTITEDFLDFARLMANLPLVIPKDSSLPLANFMEAQTILDPEYHTFEADYYLCLVSQTPRIHINTGIDFPFSIWAQLVVDAQIKYRKDVPVQEHPAIPFNHTRHIIDRWGVDFPDTDTYGPDAIQAFHASYPRDGAHSRWICIDCLWIYDGGVNLFNTSPGIKIFPDGRPGYLGTDDDRYEDFYPLNFSVWDWTAPPRKLHVSPAFQAVSGEIRGYTSTELLFVYPPICPEVIIGGLPQIVGGVLGGGVLGEGVLGGGVLGGGVLQIPPKLWTGKIDGSWRVGYGGFNII
jgi:hypothetical protein